MARKTIKECMDTIRWQAKRIEELEARAVKDQQHVSQLNGAVEGLNKLSTQRYEVIAEQALTLTEREGEIDDLVNINLLLRKQLDDGVVVAENTVDMLNKYQPCIHAFKELVHLVQGDNRNLHAVLDDAEFLDALYPRGGQNIRTLVRFILGLVP